MINNKIKHLNKINIHHQNQIKKILAKKRQNFNLVTMKKHRIVKVNNEKLKLIEESTLIAKLFRIKINKKILNIKTEEIMMISKIVIKSHNKVIKEAAMKNKIDIKKEMIINKIIKIVIKSHNKVIKEAMKNKIDIIKEMIINIEIIINKIIKV